MRRASIEVNNKRLIVVLGMHRSGTSVITRGLQVLGVGLGDRLMPPVEGNNDKGFFEDIDINSLNIEMLQILGSDWHYLSPIEASDVEEMRKKGYILRAVELLRRKIGNATIFGFKDPRVAKLLLFWKEVFAHCQFDVGYVLALRHPLSVVKSLAKRDGLDSEKSYMLWLEHVLTSISNTEGHKRVLVDYDRLMHAPERELERIAERLALEIDPKELQSYKSEFLEEGLRHTVYDLNDLLLDDTCPPLVREIYTDLLDTAVDRRRLDDAALLTKIAIWINEFERLKSILRLVDRLSGQIAGLSQAVAERDGQITNLNQVISECDGQIANLTQVMVERDVQIAGLNQAVAERDEQIANLTQMVADRDVQIASLNQAVAERDEQIASLTQVIAERDGQIASILASRSWWITKPLRALSGAVRTMVATKRLVLSNGAAGRAYRYSLARTVYHRLPLPEHLKRRLRDYGKRQLGIIPRNDYADWIRRYDTLTNSDRAAIRARIADFVNPPVISVVMPTYNTPEAFLHKAIESVRRQLYPYWELCIADDASTQPHVREVLEEYARKDSRIKVCFRECNGHISAASNSALELATGDYIALLDHDDELAEYALYWVAEEIIAHPDVEFIYSDEDKINERGERCDPYFKPDWNPELLLGQNYVCHLGVYRRARVLSIGGFRERFNGAQDWDLVVRFTENLNSNAIRHIPAVLYHWRVHPESTASSMDAKSYVKEAQYAFIQEHLERTGESATIEPVCHNTFYLPHFAVRGQPLVSILIPTRNGEGLLRQCLESLRKTDYPHTEILIIDNQSDDHQTLAYLAEIERLPGHRVLRYPHPFDFAAMHNWAVQQTRGEYICLLNNDTEVIAPNWLRDMLGLAQRPGVGAVGAKLHYPDNSIQHAGIILGIGGIAGHSHKYFSSESRDYFSRTLLVQSFSAVTGACLLVSKENWMRVGGMDPRLAIAFNDVDFCLRLQEIGLRNLWTPSALLYHHESKTRGSDFDEKKIKRFALENAYMQWRWGYLLKNDPAYNPNLTLEREDFSLAWPPRRHLPWRDKVILVDVPYGLTMLQNQPWFLQPGGMLSGTMPIPVAVRGRLSGLSVLIGNFHGNSDGILVLQLEDKDKTTAQGYVPLTGCADNDFLQIPLSGSLYLNGQERLRFRFQLEKATQPVAFWCYPVGREWGHELPDNEELALRMILHVMEDK